MKSQPRPVTLFGDDVITIRSPSTSARFHEQPNAVGSLISAFYHALFICVMYNVLPQLLIPFADVRQTQTEDKVDITASRTSPRCAVAVPPQRALLGPWPVFFGISSFSILAHHLISSAKICWLTRHFPWLTCRAAANVLPAKKMASSIVIFIYLCS